jgi:Fic family protein
MQAATLTKLPFPKEASLETVQLLKKVAHAHRYLAELKGVAKTIPNESILISTLTLQEAKDSSEIENIFTTHDQLFQASVLQGQKINQSAKEVENYRAALWESYKQTKTTGLIRFEDILRTQAVIEPNKPGIRKLPGTVIGSADGHIIYTPPQHPDEIQDLLSNVVEYINEPLVALISHHEGQALFL